MKISVIVPIYNAEKLIRRALDSIKNQSMSDFEVLMVNDGSTDGSADICNYYAYTDNRFKLISKENEGVSAARQTGLDFAQGEYVIHVDADDWVEHLMLEHLYNKAKKENADMVISDFFVNKGINQTLIKQCPSDCNSNSHIISDLFKVLHGSCWNKLVKRDCYYKYGIKFPQGLNYCEDLLTNVQLLLSPIKVCYLNEAFYHYDYSSSENSITRNYNNKTLDQRKLFVSLLTNILLKESDEVKYAKLSVKTEAYHSHVIDNETLKNLYPEIVTIINGKPIEKIIYWFAFNGHKAIADTCFKIINTIKRQINKFK